MNKNLYCNYSSFWPFCFPPIFVQHANMFLLTIPVHIRFNISFVAQSSFPQCLSVCVIWGLSSFHLCWDTPSIPFSCHVFLMIESILGFLWKQNDSLALYRALLDTSLTIISKNIDFRFLYLNLIIISISQGSNHSEFWACSTSSVSVVPKL